MVELSGLGASMSGVFAVNPLLSNAKMVVDIVGTALTALAIVIGGIWGYFKFFKGRMYSPRLDINVFGQWRLIEAYWLLQARIVVRNIGASKVDLISRGSGLRVKKPVLDDSDAPLAWESMGTFGFFMQDTFIESQVTMSEDLLLPIIFTQPMTMFFEARLVWKWTKGKRRIVVWSRRVIPVDSRVDGSESDESSRTAPAIAETVESPRGSRGRESKGRSSTMSKSILISENMIRGKSNGRRRRGESLGDRRMGAGKAADKAARKRPESIGPGEAPRSPG